MRSGDALVGGRISRIGRREIDVVVEGQVVTLKVTESKEEPLRQAAPSPAPAITAGATVLSRAELDKELQDMGSLLRKALVRPYFNAGVQEGFVISSIRPDSLYQKMGIINGDIIQEVNNRKIRTVDDVIGLLGTIKAGSSLAMTITRRGNKETLHYQFQ
jgi:general secretion pathway protein C